MDLKNTVTEETITVPNWKVGDTLTSLNAIHHKDVNITIHDRDVSAFSTEIIGLLEQNVEFRSSGSIETILKEMINILGQHQYNGIIQDIKKILRHFQKITEANSFRLLLSTVNTNMCRRFHTDINDLRLLCTYSGPGTLWLTEDNVNRKALDTCGDNECIVLDENKVQQAPTGAIVILKGAIYPKEGTAAVVHRSPTIEETGQKRLLLRIDTNEFLNFV